MSCLSLAGPHAYSYLISGIKLQDWWSLVLYQAAGLEEAHLDASSVTLCVLIKALGRPFMLPKRLKGLMCNDTLKAAR